MWDIVRVPDYLTPDEAAAMIGVTARTIRRWVEADRIRHVRLPSGHLRIPTEAVTDLLADAR